MNYRHKVGQIMAQSNFIAYLYDRKQQQQQQLQQLDRHSTHTHTETVKAEGRVEVKGRVGCSWPTK